MGRIIYLHDESIMKIIEKTSKTFCAINRQIVNPDLYLFLFLQ